MNQEQFGQFWTPLKAPLKAKWEEITHEDLLEIDGNLTTFGSVLRKRYGEGHKERSSPGSTADILTGPENWARRRTVTRRAPTAYRA